jgi:fatty acid CoA ligase FadD9
LSGARETVIAQASGSESAMRRMARLVARDEQIRSLKVSHATLAALRASPPRAAARIATACDVFADRPCLGVASSGGCMTFSTLTYRELWQRVIAAATHLSRNGIVVRGACVGIYADTGVDWVVADLACLYLGAVSVPMQRGAALDDLVHVARETELACIFADRTEGAAIAHLVERCPAIRDVVVLGGAASIRHSPAVRVHDLDQIVAAGVQGAVQTDAAAAADELFSVVYTSGSTGRPKGVMVTEGRWAETLGDSLRRTPIPTITVGYLPLSHMAGRISLYTTMMVGGQVNLVASDDKFRLLDAIRATRPTVLTLVPRVSGLIHQQFLALVLRQNVDLAAGYGDAGVATALRTVRDEWLGGRLCFATTGAAPTAPDVARFVAEGLGVHVIDAYGSTEVARIAVDGLVQPDVDYRLVDLPELGYTTRDRPYPRGELVVKSPRQTPGYFKNAEANASLYEADGYIRTGDIVEERAPRHIVWIDRKSDVVRLTNGVNVNVSRLESLFETHSPYVEQIFICGETNRDSLLAVVVPNAPLLAERCGSGEERDRAAENLLHAEIARVAAEHRLPSHEVPRGLLLADEPFTRENGLLSDAKKFRRPNLRERYRARLGALYSTIAERQVRALLDAAGSGESIEEQSCAAVAAVLGRRELDESDLTRSFTNLGGDSIAAIRLRDVLGNRLDLSALLDPDKSLRSILGTVAQGGPDRDALTARTLHGDDEKWAHAGDFELAGLLPPALVSAAPRLPLSREPKHYLLTGATGFLGQVVLEALLEKLERRDCSITCIVRATDDAAAYARVAAKFDSAGVAAARLLASWTQRSRLRVLAGDVASPCFGLRDSAYAELGERVDAVLHCGALVNHLLSYADLFAPNVRGTMEVMRFAISCRRKRVHFVSTTGVATGWQGSTPVPEEQHASALWRRRRLEASGYASGYTTSKWASEIMLWNLSRACDVPVAVHRCSMILPHRGRSDTFNASDSFSRLLYGIVRTGVAPTSFYAEDYAGDRHYDALPVDFVAAALAEICASPDEQFRTYHVSNPNWHDGVCIDKIVSWVESAGYAIERLEHGAWYAEFVERLRELSGDAQRRSPQQIAHRWREPITAGKGPFRLATGNFGTALASSGVAAIPSLDQAYIQRSVRGICGANR